MVIINNYKRKQKKTKFNYNNDEIQTNKTNPMCNQIKN